MEILTESPEIYQKNIDKYCKNKRKWKVLDKISKFFQYMMILCIIAFYSFFVAYIFTKFSGGNYDLMFKIMIGTIFLGILSVFGLIFSEWRGFSLTTRDKIWYFNEQIKNVGYKLENITIWQESDKVHAHLTFNNDKNEKIQEYYRMDEFTIEYSNSDNYKINLDTYEIIIPEKEKNKNIILFETD